MRTFRDFMENALYDPERGYYARREPRVDFYTAPELHPAFAGVLAGDIAKRLAALSERGAAGTPTIVEMGAGEGRLARQLRAELAKTEWAETRYVVVERCQSLLVQTAATLGVEGYVRLEDMPPCAGVFLSNELVDAFPVHVLQKRGEQILELFVDRDGSEHLGPISDAALLPYADAVAEALEEGDRHAVSLESLRWLELAASRLTDGFLMTIDYGKRFGAMPNPPRAFYRHSLPETLTSRPGEQDLTASVDFDSLIAKGRALGLGLESFTTLSRFLLDRGIERWLEAGDTAAALKSRSQVKTLLHPEGMGEAFKVLIQRKGGNPASC